MTGPATGSPRQGGQHQRPHHRHGPAPAREALEVWLEKNSPAIEDFLAERYEAGVTTDEGWTEAGIKCTAQIQDGPLTQGQVVDAAWSGTKVVQFHNESDHGSFRM